MLEGLLIVELASVLAGPAVGQFFAELGARVIKIENSLAGGDVTRQWKVSGEDAAKKDSAYFKSVNYGKESHWLDLTDPVEREACYELIKKADLVITNYPERTAQKLGMEVERLLKLKTDLIVAQLSAFPPEQAGRPAYDIVLQAETGFLSMTGTKDGELCRMPVALIDILAAHQLKEGILLALLKRSSTGKGSVVRVNLYDAAVASLANQATNYLIADKVARPMGSQHPNIAPYGDLFETSDGEKIVLAVGSDRQFTSLCSLLSLETPASLATNSERVKNREELISFLREPIRRQHLTEFLLLCESVKVPVGHVKDLAAVFDQSSAKALLLTHPDGEQSVKTVVFEIEDR